MVGWIGSRSLCWQVPILNSLNEQPPGGYPPIEGRRHIVAGGRRPRLTLWPCDKQAKTLFDLVLDLRLPLEQLHLPSAR